MASFAAPLVGFFFAATNAHSSLAWHSLLLFLLSLLLLLSGLPLLLGLNNLSTIAVASLFGHLQNYEGVRGQVASVIIKLRYAESARASGRQTQSSALASGTVPPHHRTRQLAPGRLVLFPRFSLPRIHTCAQVQHSTVDARIPQIPIRPASPHRELGLQSALHHLRRPQPQRAQNYPPHRDLHQQTQRPPTALPQPCCPPAAQHAVPHMEHPPPDPRKPSQGRPGSPPYPLGGQPSDPAESHEQEDSHQAGHQGQAARPLIHSVRQLPISNPPRIDPRLIQLMKGSNSQYSRPTTAKRGIVSPRLPSKKESPTRTEPVEQIDPQELMQLIEETIARQKDCEARGKYVEADSFKKKAKALREQLEDREMEETRFRHEKELKELEEAHLAEMNLFQLEWNKQIADFNQEIEKALQELAERQEMQLREAEGDYEPERKFHESPKLLELRKVEQQLGKQQDYLAAHRIQIKANRLEKEQMEKHKKSSNNKTKLSLQQLRSKQEAETQAAKQRIQMQVEENELRRTKEETKLRQKYENIMRETELQHSQQVIKLNKAVKLNQLQNKSRVGAFSYSHDR